MVDNSKNDPENQREGGREGAKRLTPELSGNAASRPRNSSGNASNAAALLDLRVKLNLAYEMIEALCERLGDEELLTEVKRIRQRGFRTGR